ncbi:MAG: DivIVA domain-containing protein [Solirubrobacteraceae bacterium]
MALERQSIEKRDFPIGRRGYDPDAVDAHLSALAEAVDELKLTSRRRSETLASAASEQVRAIVEAAENTGADIQRQAEDEAREIRAEAVAEAQATREHATGQAREYVGSVSESTAVMLQRLDAIESEFGALIDSLRKGATRLAADLEQLGANIGDVRSAVALRPRFELEAAQAESDLQPESESEPERPEPEPEQPEPEPEPEPVAASAPAPAREEPQVQHARDGVDTPQAGDDDTESARLIALNMALSGTSRAETDRYLADNFKLRDRAALLDDVYASVEA